MKKIAVVTTTRAEYGILKPLLVRLFQQSDFETQLIVSGTHLSKEFGYTIDEIEQDQIAISRQIPIYEQTDEELAVSKTMARAMIRFSEYFAEETPNLVIVLGDRTELLGICGAAVVEGIPIAHIHGGELTEGAVDDDIRHAITKMSYLHFPSTEVYRKRIIQMGEEPTRVFNVGALSTENILNEELLSKAALCHELNLDLTQPYVVVTYHPVTRERDCGIHAVKELLQAMEQCSEYQYIITNSNADSGGQTINQLVVEFGEQHDNVRLVTSLGMKRYLSAIKHCAFVMGNSSSGVIEAPVFGVPTVNIGERQAGRLMASTVIQSETDTTSILQAMHQAEQIKSNSSEKLFGDGHTSEKIVAVLREVLMEEKVNIKKKFYDIPFNMKE